MARRKAAPRIVCRRERFRELRIQFGQTQRSLSLELDVTEGFIREIESGRSNPEITFAFKVAKYFGTTVDDVFQDLKLIDSV